MRVLLPFYKFLPISFMLMLAGHHHASATHLRAGEITVVRDNCQSLQFRITITVYTNTGSSVLFGGRVGEEDILDFGDGATMLVPETPNTPRPDLGPNIGTASFTIVHTYPGPGTYTISYREPNRNEGVLNMDNSVNTRFYIETQIKIDPFLGCNNTPVLLIPPIDQSCTGVAFFHNPGAFDPDGDSLSYELVTPYSDRGLPVIRYQDPAANSPRTFYTNGYETANEAQDGPPTFSIDPIDGTMLWDAAGAQGEYNVAFVIKEWRKIAGLGWVEVGFVRRDMQILVNDCNNERPDLIIPADTCVEAGTTLTAKILGIDPENHPVKIEAFSEIFNFGDAQSPATISPVPDFRPSNPPYELNFEWKTICEHVKEQSYQVVFKITDNPPTNTGPKLVTFKTWNIRVVGPKPVWQTAVIDNGERSTSLDWDDYVCANAETMKIYRRVDSFPYEPDNCETGMPSFLGYELIGEQPVSAPSEFVDTNGGRGLAPGARYCYRLVAEFPSPKGGESYMSEEICVGPILADAPVITNVTIDRTSQTDGQITVKWREPFDVDPVQFPPPYTYKVVRGSGFTGTPDVVITATATDQLTAVDLGLNTTDEIYNYMVVAYSGAVTIDTSAIASSVRLDAQSQLNQINLSWNAFVPWSNTSASYPRHLIYRGPEGATEEELELIDSVNVTVDGFVYGDHGQYNGEPLEDDQVYCYRVMTRGSYGNPEIDEPLINFSQIICTQPSDSIPPCQVALPISVNGPDCNNYTASECSKTVFSNRIEWTRPNEGTCQNDIAYYNVYSASSTDGSYVLRATQVRDLFFVDENLPSYARCYRVSAVDRSGNEGELSEPLCIDNCPYYELPNVFTPNGDADGCNELFSAYSDNSRYETDSGEGTQLLCGGVTDETKCARFVDRVVFTVYNRWGKEVYSYQSGSEKSIYIDWDGRDENGRELSGGVYYYMAEVTFVSIDPSKRNQTIKGWVHILR